MSIAGRMLPAGLVLVLAACGASPPSASTAPESKAEPVASTATVPPSGTARPTETVTATASEPEALTFEVETFPVTAGSRPHDVAPAVDGGVWYTGQGNGTLGWLDPDTGEVREIGLGVGSAPHGVITGPDGDAWVTDGGLNAIVRVDAETRAVTSHALGGSVANLNTATFDGAGILWFTGQNGIYGRLDPTSGEMRLFDAPRGPGPYGIAATPQGDVVFSSLAGSYIGIVDRDSGEVTVIDTPTPSGGARRVWPDSAGRFWVTEWNAGLLAMYDPDAAAWTEVALPSEAPMPYAVYVDEREAVWVTDFGANAIHRYDPATETWESFPLESQPADVRQLLGRAGEVWGAESAADQLVVIRTTGP